MIGPIDPPGPSTEGAIPSIPPRRRPNKWRSAAALCRGRRETQKSQRAAGTVPRALGERYIAGEYNVYIYIICSPAIYMNVCKSTNIAGEHLMCSSCSKLMQSRI